jgi:hypothetical protein
LQRLGEPISVLLSVLARSSQHDDSVAFEAGTRQLEEVSLQLLPSEVCTLGALRHALEELAQTAPKLRQRLVDAAAACICADADVNVPEAELLRAVCDMLDCPMPPLLPGQAVRPAEQSRREPSHV